MKLAKLLLLSFAFPLWSCHSMAGQGMSISALQSDVSSVPLVDSEGANFDSRVSTAELPLRIGIAPPVSTLGGWGNDRGTLVYGSWSDKERAVIEVWLKRAQESGLVQSHEFLPSILADTRAPNVLSAVRGAARSRNLDAVLAVRVGSTHQTSATSLSFLDLALVPAFIFPTASFEATAIFEGVLLDTNSGYPYAVGSAQASYEKKEPSMTGRAKDHIGKARLRALGSMGQRLLDSVDLSAVKAAQRSAEFREQQHERSIQYWTREPTSVESEE
ncbi:MAG: hypothetical protein GY930_22255 [bacterium]|nr:hypothetical protein [bacterium]